MKRQKIKIELIETNEGQIEGVPSNPRFIKDLEFEKLKQSIKDFPEMLQIREVVVYPLQNRFIALGGNMRFRACKELGYKEIETDNFNSTMFLKLIFSENEYTFVKEKLAKIADTPEKAILNLLQHGI